MKRCKHCGHTNGRMRVYNPPYCPLPPSAPKQWECSSPYACIRRQEQIGQWIGKRVLRRRDHDGTEWTIRPEPDGTVQLVCVYRQHHLTSRHPTAAAAQEHADELLASFFRPKAEDYRVDEPDPDQMELAP